MPRAGKEGNMFFVYLFFLTAVLMLPAIISLFIAIVVLANTNQNQRKNYGNNSRNNSKSNYRSNSREMVNHKTKPQKTNIPIKPLKEKKDVEDIVSPPDFDGESVSELEAKLTSDENDVIDASEYSDEILSSDKEDIPDNIGYGEQLAS